MNAVSKLFLKAKRFFAPREKFLVLELAPGGADASFLSVDDDHNLIFEKSVYNVDLKKLLQSPLRRMYGKPWGSNYFFAPRRKIVVTADSSLATTMPVPFDLGRERARWKNEITLDEIENLIAQEMQKVFTQCRSEASKRLATLDIHAILVGAKAEHFKIDGRAVMNPIGFMGKKISLVLELTFAGRGVFDELRQFFNSPEEFFFVEAPQAWMRTVLRTRRLPINVISPSRTLGATPKVRLGSSLFILPSEEQNESKLSFCPSDGKTNLFIFQKQKRGGNYEYPILFRKKLAWSFDAVWGLVAKALGVTDAVAHELYRAYRAGSFSAVAERNFKKMIKPAVDALLDELERAKINGSVYLHLPHETPFDMPYKHGGITFEALPVNEILTELGLQVDKSVAPFRHLAPFLESYFSKSTSEINQKLKRRLHWLAE